MKLESANHVVPRRRRGILVMYDSASCSYSGALDLKGVSGTTGSTTAVASGITTTNVKQESWPYRGLACGSTFQQLKQSVEKAKQALADRGSYLAGAFSPPPRANPSAISPSAASIAEKIYPSFCVNLRLIKIAKLSLKLL
ncbi:hypothetical protein PV327_003063 [Microctonus hyperodae]|uniref:Uncharacterized protein n=1 Tax=Microctonus hyperodae TaxID=165561 RepID=A0AA39G437_MICHY|nr:hypothetical protein PV327_003063 [Microctonus hyperodae]